MEEIPSSVLMVILIVDGSSEGNSPCRPRTMAVVKMGERMWKCTAALKADVAIHSNGIDGFCRHWRTVLRWVLSLFIQVKNRYEIKPYCEAPPFLTLFLEK